MSIYEKYAANALSLGFTRAVILENLSLTCQPELRAYCNAEQCQSFGSTWVCPPGCGLLKECQERISDYSVEIVLQTVSELPPHEEKLPWLHRLQREHNTRFLELADIARRDDNDVLPLTTGGCVVCDACPFPDNPCREPIRKMHSLSAYGIDVAQLCEKAGLDFSFRDDMVYYTACLMFR